MPAQGLHYLLQVVLALARDAYLVVLYLGSGLELQVLDERIDIFGLLFIDTLLDRDFLLQGPAERFFDLGIEIKELELDTLFGRLGTEHISNSTKLIIILRIEFQYGTLTNYFRVAAAKIISVGYFLNSCIYCVINGLKLDFRSNVERELCQNVSPFVFIYKAPYPRDKELGYYTTGCFEISMHISSRHSPGSPLYFRTDRDEYSPPLLRRYHQKILDVPGTYILADIWAFLQ